MLVRVWEYDVPEAQRLECVGRPGHYLTVDRFTDEAAWQGFLARHSDDYARLDDECASLTLAEHEVIAGTAD